MGFVLEDINLENDENASALVILGAIWPASVVTAEEVETGSVPSYWASFEAGLMGKGVAWGSWNGQLFHGTDMAWCWWSKRYKTRTKFGVECKRESGTWCVWRGFVDPGFQVQVLDDVGGG